MPRPRAVLEEQQQLLRLALREAPRTDSARVAAEYAAVVARLVDDPHPHLRAALPALLATLPRRDRQLLHLRIGEGHTCRAVRLVLGLGTRFAVDPYAATILAALACRLWDDRGLPLVPAPAPLRGGHALAPVSRP